MEFILSSKSETENYNKGTIRLNFFEIWSITKIIPMVYKGGKSGNLTGLNVYEYTFKVRNNLVDNFRELEINDTDNYNINFTIYKWDDKFTKTADWIIASNTRKEELNEAFIKYIKTNVKLHKYNGKSFKSDDKTIKESIGKNKEILRFL